MLAPWKESYDQPRQHIQKQRHYFVNKGPSCQTMAFPVVMYACENWTIKKAEHWRIDAFELWFWRRLLRVPWTARRSNQSILKEIWCWSWNSSTLATWCNELTHLKRPWCWERLRAGGGGVDRGWDGWMASPAQWTWVWVNSGSWWWTGRPGLLRYIGLQRVRRDWATELNWKPRHILSKDWTVKTYGLMNLILIFYKWNVMTHFVEAWKSRLMGVRFSYW